jgi:hypothetical protein
VCAALAALAGWGGGGGGKNASCSDACNHLFSCATKLGISGSEVAATFGNENYDNAPDCIAHCEVGTCPNQQELQNCADRVSCNSFPQVVAHTTTCLDNSGCSP